MQGFEILKKIDNGSLHTSHEIAYDCSIREFIDEQIIAGDKETVDGDTFYSNLRLTKGGKNLLRFSKLTINDIDNACGKNSIKSWLLRPLVFEICKFMLLALLAIIGGVYSSDIKDMLSLPQVNIQQETQTEQDKPKQNYLHEKINNQ